MEISDSAAFARHFDVSRETSERLTCLRDAVVKWSRRINLIGPASVETIWGRHIADSAQLWALRPPEARIWADLGAGAGFPGLVIAAMAADAALGLNIVLVESDTRKAVFLAEAARAMDVTVQIKNERVESLPGLRADVVSARALAPLDRLLGYLEKHRSGDGIGLFPKGAKVHKEIETAARVWRFEPRIHPSITEPGAAIVEVGAVSRA